MTCIKIQKSQNLTAKKTNKITNPIKKGQEMQVDISLEDIRMVNKHIKRIELPSLV